jgi:hypothetical protein
VDRTGQGGRGSTGEYRLLYKYLRDRFADRVVLTFGEIEDLLGFSLPEPARLQGDWWSTASTSGHPSEQSDAWTFASRTAVVNLSSQRVVFDRAISRDLSIYVSGPNPD